MNRDLFAATLGPSPAPSTDAEPTTAPTAAPSTSPAPEHDPCPLCAAYPFRTAVPLDSPARCACPKAPDCQHDPDACTKPRYHVHDVRTSELCAPCSSSLALALIATFRTEAPA